MKKTPNVLQWIGIGMLALLFACDDEQAGPSTPPVQGPEVISENIVEDRVLENIVADPTKPDYRVTKLLDVTAKLTIKPGVVLHFEKDAGFQIQETGTLIADGTAADKIIFTGTTQTPGFWAGIKVRSKTATNSISHAEINNAGSLKAGTYLQKAALSPEYTKIALDNILISNSGQYGIQTREDETILNMSNITFKDNMGSHMYIHPEQIQYVDANSNFNGGYVEVWGGGTSTSGPAFSWVNPMNGKYLISQDLSINKAVTIAPGTVFEAADGVLITVAQHADSKIVAQGTASQPIVFTSQTNEPGAWKGLFIDSYSDHNLLEYVRIENGGSSKQGTWIEPTNLGIGWVTKLTMNNVNIENSAGYGMYVRNNPSEIVLNMSGVAYANNALGDMVVEE